MRPHPLMLFIVVLAIAGQIVGVVGLAQASADSIESIQTPATYQLEWALDRINNPDEPLLPEEIRAHFTPEFVAALDEQQIIWVFHGYVAPSGPISVARYEGGPTRTRANALLYGANGLWRVTFGVESREPYRINDLFFEPIASPQRPIAAPEDWSSFKRDVFTVAPKVSFVAAEVNDGVCQPLARVRADEPLAIASSFKLYVLGALAHQIDVGQASWDDQIALDPNLISMPNGDMRYLPVGELYPVTYVAEQMISQSDNTATDHLIAYLGRETVEAAFQMMGQQQPELNVPLMLTREWFAMRMRFTDDELNEFANADEGEKRAILARADPIASTLAEIEAWPALRAIDSVEWFASAADLCRAMAYLQQSAVSSDDPEILNALSLEPGLPLDPAIWTYVGYKGGYETGVFSNTWLLQRNDGRWFVISAIINDPDAEIDGTAVMNLVPAAADLLAKQH